MKHEELNRTQLEGVPLKTVLDTSDHWGVCLVAWGRGNPGVQDGHGALQLRYSM